MKSRLSIPAAPAPITRADAEQLMRELAIAANQHRQLNADRDDAILKINASYEQRLAECERVVKDKTKTLHAWAAANPAEFPARSKTIILLSGQLGFRTGTPKLVPLSKAWTWDIITRAVSSLLPAFIRNKPEVDREALLAQRDEPIIQYALKKCGLKVDQTERFYVEPNLDETDDRQTEPV